MSKEIDPNELILIQGNNIVFAEETSYKEDGENYTRTVKVTKGVLRCGEEQMIVLHPFDVFVYGLCSTQN